MGKVYSPPDEVGDAPKITEGAAFFNNINENINKHNKKIVEWIEKVKAYAREHGEGEFAGEIVRFPFADSYAQYVVFSLKPVKLIHLPVGDAWQFPYANRLTASDIKKQIQYEKRMAELFKKGKE